MEVWTRSLFRFRFVVINEAPADRDVRVVMRNNPFFVPILNGENTSVTTCWLSTLRTDDKIKGAKTKSSQELCLDKSSSGDPRAFDRPTADARFEPIFEYFINTNQRSNWRIIITTQQIVREWQ